jgi:hypothetical protein
MFSSSAISHSNSLLHRPMPRLFIMDCDVPPTGLPILGIAEVGLDRQMSGILPVQALRWRVAASSMIDLSLLNPSDVGLAKGAVTFAQVDVVVVPRGGAGVPHERDGNIAPVRDETCCRGVSTASPAREPMLARKAIVTPKGSSDTPTHPSRCKRRKPMILALRFSIARSHSQTIPAPVTTKCRALA